MGTQFENTFKAANMNSFSVLFFVLVAATSAFADATNKDFNKLYTDIVETDDYNNILPPIEGDHKVDFGMEALCLSLSETGVLCGRVWLKLQWQDERLSWDPEDYGGVKQMNVETNELWMPDIYPYQKLDNQRMMHPERTPGAVSNAIVYSSGTVLHVPDMPFEVQCDGANFDCPWAEQECTFKYGSWTYSGNYFSMGLMENKTFIGSSSYNDKCQVQIIDSSLKAVAKKYPCCEEAYWMVKGSFKVRRQYLQTDKGLMMNPNPLEKPTPQEKYQEDEEEAIELDI